ncbi:MAG TPA: multidrug efflux RND transporter permease subunit [Inquilinus sp.]
MLSSIFVDRPRFAIVIAIVITLAGLIAIRSIPIAQFPDIVPPQVSVTGSYPGASAAVVESTVAQPIEAQVNGVDNMLYMSSTSGSDGSYSLMVSFAVGTDPDINTVNVQNRVALAEPKLPSEVTAQGLTVKKQSSAILQLVTVYSPDGSQDALYLNNYAIINLIDSLARVRGVGQASLFATQNYAMRIWYNTDTLNSFALSPNDIITAVQSQNVQAAVGRLGAQPMPDDQQIQVTLQTLGRLSDVKQFEDIILRANPDGSVVRLRDVARLELNSQSYDTNARLNGSPAAVIGIYQSPGSNAVAAAEGVRSEMERLKQRFPAGVDYKITYDTTVFVSETIGEVIKTLLEAFVLVAIVVFVFLGNLRATLIPIIAVPVSLIDTFAVLLAFGFSANTISMFAMILAIGIVVDDAIVVVENVERNIEQGLSPVQATYRAMQEVSGPIIAIALVLVAVFVPLAFITGLTGQFYRQFALTIAISTVISAINSLTLSPALAALLLRNHHAPKDWLTRAMDKVFGWFFRGFNRFFGRSSEAYGRGVGRILSRKSLIMGVYVLLLGVTFVLFRAVPGGFVPAQDKQYLIGFAQLPDAATLDRSEDVIRRMSDIALKHPGVENAIAFPGLSINGFTNSSNSGIVFVALKPFEERTTPELSGGAIAMQLNQEFGAIQDAFIAMFPPPPVQGLGTTGGFKLQIEDKNGLGYQALDEATKAFIAKAYQTPELAGIYSSFQINVPQLYADLDRVKARQLGVEVTDVFETLQIYLGSLYVNDFNAFGRTYSVRVQADANYRSHADDIGKLKVRSQSGEMIPLSALLKVEQTVGAERAIRYNGFLSADINGGPAPGFSSGQAQAAIEKIAAETLPPGIAFEWTDLTYQQILAGNSGMLVFPLALLLVYLVLAAQYESLTLPIAIILIVPMGIMAALAGVWLTGGDNNVFTQIGLIVLVGLSAKNAILIVEFARELELSGSTAVQAAIEASRLRLRPILMTSMAFIMGVVPLVISTGAGAEMRSAMGVAVFSGMIGVTAFGIFMTPVFYVLIRKLSGERPLKHAGAHIEAPHLAPGE